MKKNTGGYKEALDFILAREHFGIKLGLHNITAFLEASGRPHDRFPSVHIAGTNGKGSTAAAIDAIMRKAGYRVGMFTSPHLVDFRERFRVNGTRMTRDYVTKFIARHRDIIEEHRITFFEVCTALAFNYFADRKVDLAVVEVGLGGRLDATNTLAPLLSIITDISYDHTNILGETLRKIAYEKAGIIKEGTPVLAGVLPPEAEKEVVRVCRNRKAPLSMMTPGDISMNGVSFRFDFHQNGIAIPNLRFALPGQHQIGNAALAIKAVHMLRENGFTVTKRAVRSGLKNTIWPGRFEILNKNGGPTVILDVGHNPAGVRATVACFKQMFPGRRADVVMGFVRYKSLKEIVATLEPITNRVEIACLKTERSTDPNEIASHFKDRSRVTISSSVVSSARKLMKSANRDDIILVCGSHYAVGEFKARQKRIL